MLMVTYQKEKPTMATSTSATDEFADIELDDYEPSQAGKYDRHVRATLARDVELEESDPDAFESGKRTRVSITVPNDDVDGEVRQFQDAARSHDRTARKVATAPQGDGYTRVSFILIPKQTRPRKNKGGDTDTAE